jgi:hypothetical protein
MGHVTTSGCSDVLIKSAQSFRLPGYDEKTPVDRPLELFPTMEGECTAGGLVPHMKDTGAASVISVRE